MYVYTLSGHFIITHSVLNVTDSTWCWKLRDYIIQLHFSVGLKSGDSGGHLNTLNSLWWCCCVTSLEWHLHWDRVSCPDTSGHLRMTVWNGCTWEAVLAYRLWHLNRVLIKKNLENIITPPRIWTIESFLTALTAVMEFFFCRLKPGNESAF